MPSAIATSTEKEKRLNVRDLCRRIEEVLEAGSRESACELLPELRLLCEKVKKIRRLCPSAGAIGLSKYVVAVASLAGRREEFAEFA